MRRSRRHLSYANVASTLALVFIPAASAVCAATGDTSAEVLTFDHTGTATALPFTVLFG
jgi:hypothetical protein